MDREVAGYLRKLESLNRRYQNGGPLKIKWKEHAWCLLELMKRKSAVGRIDLDASFLFEVLGWKAGQCQWGSMLLIIVAPWLPAGGRPSLRLRAFDLLVEKTGDQFIHALSSGPNVGLGGDFFWGKDYCDSWRAQRADPYPVRRAGEPGCGCMERPCRGCGRAYCTSNFFDPRNHPPLPGTFFMFPEDEQRAILDVFPRALLEWNLDAWRFDARLEANWAEDVPYWDDIPPEKALEAALQLMERRQQMLSRAEESLRWASPGRACRGAWVAAVVRAALRR